MPLSRIWEDFPIPANMTANRAKLPCRVSWYGHPKGDLLWDTGLGDHYNYPKEGSDAAPGVHVTVPVTLLATICNRSS